MLTYEENVPLAPMTTFHIGGAARYLARARSVEDVTEIVLFAVGQRLPLFVLGGGSNVLVSDAGFPGVVLKLENRDVLQVGDGRVVVGAGLPLLDLVRFTCERGLRGIEPLAGIPGSVGGAVRGNAGAFGTDVGAWVERVSVLDRETTLVEAFTREECRFRYRHSTFKAHPNLLILEVVLALESGESASLQTIAEETIAKRDAKHPQNALCVGSFYMNPVVADTALRAEFEHEKGMAVKDDKLPAGWLIEHAGLKGKRIGGAQVSEIQANYIVNTGGATAEDVIILSSLVKQRVRVELGVQLTEEVQLVGF